MQSSQSNFFGFKYQSYLSYGEMCIYTLKPFSPIGYTEITERYHLLLFLQMTRASSTFTTISYLLAGFGCFGPISIFKSTRIKPICRLKFYIVIYYNYRNSFVLGKPQISIEFNSLTHHITNKLNTKSHTVLTFKNHKYQQL